MTPEYILRHHVKQDENLIYSSWIKGAYEVFPTNFIPRELYLEHQSKHIKYCLDHFTTYILCHPDDPDEIFGYVCFSTVGQSLIVHWLYIHNIWRKRFTGESMVPTLLSEIHPGWDKQQIVVTQISKHFKSKCPKCQCGECLHNTNLQKKYNLVYDPYYLEGKYV